MDPIKTIEIATAFIANEEEFRATVYLDVGGKPTIGYCCTDPEIIALKTITEPHARKLLERTVMHTLNTITEHCKNDFTENQAAALCSLTYNIGVNAFLTSTLFKMLQLNNIDEAPDQFNRWIYVHHVVNTGLQARRSREIELWYMD